MKKEWLAIYNENMERVGKKEREVVHRDEDWLETFHCWFVEKTEQPTYLYFQLRSYKKRIITVLSFQIYIQHSRFILYAHA